jgi:hypothetical protein
MRKIGCFVDPALHGCLDIKSGELVWISFENEMFDYAERQTLY